jgi:hypothetical protein
MGVSQSVGSLSRVLGPFAAGFSFAALGRDSPYFLGVLLVVIPLLLAFKLPRVGATRLAEAAPFGQESGPAR